MTATLLSGCTEGFKRWKKDLSSNYQGGLERTVTVYDYNGKLIKEYSGRMDVENTNGVTKFDLEGKRVMIKDAIVITEEKGIKTVSERVE